MNNGDTYLLRSKNKLEYEGMEFESNTYGKFTVLEYISNVNIVIKFLKTGFVTKTTLTQIQLGTVADKLLPRLYGVGVLGGKYPLKDGGKTKREYKLWSGMLYRCYDDGYKKRFPTYNECEVSDYFKRYDNFHEWCNTQKGFTETGWHLDKDLIVSGNKFYSENNCVFLPELINLAIVKPKKSRDLPTGVSKVYKSRKFIARISRYGNTESLGAFSEIEDACNIYKEAKKSYIAELADKYKHLLDERAHVSLINYEV